MTDILFWSTLLLLVGSTIWVLWRTRGAVSAAVLVAVIWIALVPIPVSLRQYSPPTGLFPNGFIGAPRDNMYVAIAIANVAFVAFQWLVSSKWFATLRSRTVGFFAARERPQNDGGSRLLRTWVLSLAIIAIALGVTHMALMPRIPAWDLITGYSDPLLPNYDREAADKFLPVPTFVRYIFDWNQGIVFPILFTATVLMRWRPVAIVVGIFGFIYVTSTLEKFPSLLFVMGPFVALAVRNNRPLWSKLVIGGLALGLLGPLAINQAPGISISIHEALHSVPPASAAPVDPSISTPVPGCGGSVVAVSAPFDWRNLPASIRDLYLRRLGLVPAEVTYGWFAYFPAQQGFLNGSGWEPWKVLRSGYRNPANLVGLWMYCGHGVTLPTVSAYGSFIADGWGEFGILGVIVASVGLVLFGLVLELIRGFVAKPFLLACYGPSVLLFASLPPRAGLLATIVSSGLWLVPVLGAVFLLSESLGGKRVRQAAALEHAGS